GGRSAGGAAERADVRHLPALPDERVHRAGGGEALADDLTAVVDRARRAASAAERSEVGHGPRLPQEPVAPGRPSRETRPDDLSAIVDRRRAAVARAGRAEVGHLPALPGKGALAPIRAPRR